MGVQPMRGALLPLTVTHASGYLVTFCPLWSGLDKVGDVPRAQAARRGRCQPPAHSRKNFQEMVAWLVLCLLSHCHHPRPTLLDFVQRHLGICSTLTLQHMFSASPEGRPRHLTRYPSDCNHSGTTLRFLPDQPICIIYHVLIVFFRCTAFEK